MGPFWMRIAVVWAACVGVMVCAGCSGPYDAGVREYRRAQADPVRIRVREMVQSAERALDALEDAHARASATADRSPGSVGVDRVSIDLREAESAVFETERRSLSVHDVADADMQAALLARVDACAAGLRAAYGVVARDPGGAGAAEAIARARALVREVESADGSDAGPASAES